MKPPEAISYEQCKQYAQDKVKSEKDTSKTAKEIIRHSREFYPKSSFLILISKYSVRFNFIDWIANR